MPVWVCHIKIISIMMLYFSVRLREDKKTFAICISYQMDTRHYLIDKDENNKFGIQDGPKFDCIMMVCYKRNKYFKKS
jgi:hypothetical protein